MDFGLKITDPPFPGIYGRRSLKLILPPKAIKVKGWGLAIVKELIQSYQGEITVESDENLTVFQGRIPKKIK